MPSVIEHKKFVFVSNNINSNKCWEVLLYDNNDVEVKYGRIGSTLQSKTHSGAGRKKMESLIRDKTTPKDHYDGGCYREIEVLETAGNNTTSIKTSSKAELKEIAKEQIATCPNTRKLIEFFTEVNAHDIYQATGGKITFDTSSGLFKTPLGIVVRKNIDAARELLDDLTDFVTKQNFNKKFITTLEDYLMYIPQDVGRKFDPKTFCGDIAAIQKQSQILDGLEASLQTVLSSSKSVISSDEPVEKPKLFTTKLNAIEDKKEIDAIIKYFNEGKQSMHVSSKLKYKQAFKIDMPVMLAAWEKHGAKLSNIHRLWHGTMPSNCLSILKNGFVIPPASASHVCGRMFAGGTYFANSSTKSLNYATSYWRGKDEGRYFMFLCDVALGKYQVPSGPTSKYPDKGYDSYWAKKGISGVVNDEIIVQKTSQINPVYLTEWN
jgi:poly [ADP-ribose] polymerase